MSTSTHYSHSPSVHSLSPTLVGNTTQPPVTERDITDQNVTTHHQAHSYPPRPSPRLPYVGFAGPGGQLLDPDVRANALCLAGVRGTLSFRGTVLQLYDLDPPNVSIGTTIQAHFFLRGRPSTVDFQINALHFVQRELHRIFIAQLNTGYEILVLVPREACEEEGGWCGWLSRACYPFSY